MLFTVQAEVELVLAEVVIDAWLSSCFDLPRSPNYEGLDINLVAQQYLPHFWPDEALDSTMLLEDYGADLVVCREEPTGCQILPSVVLGRCLGSQSLTSRSLRIRDFILLQSHEVGVPAASHALLLVPVGGGFRRRRRMLVGLLGEPGRDLGELLRSTSRLRQMQVLRATLHSKRSMSGQEAATNSAMRARISPGLSPGIPSCEMGRSSQPSQSL